MEYPINKLLESIFRTHFNVKNIDWTPLSEHVKIKDCSKNTTIRTAYQTERNLYYILSGATASLAYKEGKLVCIDLCFKGEFFGDYSSLISNNHSPLELRSLTRCQYLSFPFTRLLETYAQLPSQIAEAIGRQSAEHLYILKQQELIELKTLSAAERYTNLLEKQPEIFQQIPLKYIASYLGMTAESLSRIRKSNIK